MRRVRVAGGLVLHVPMGWDAWAFHGVLYMMRGRRLFQRVIRPGQPKEGRC